MTMHPFFSASPAWRKHRPGAFTLIELLLLIGLIPAVHSAKPIALHPANPHYFLFRGQPAILITGTEHYGAVLNLDFDYLTYLNTLKADGLNLTRTFAGAYVEHSAAFNISHNTLAPLPNRFLCPWSRSPTPGYANGGNKFDLQNWDQAYFKRLKDFVAQAGKRGLVVEFVLFCPFYEDAQWSLSPMNAANNIQGIGATARTNVYTLGHHDLLPVQEALVRKLVTELKDFDNLYYEICNEPYFGGVTLDWQAHIAKLIVETEKKLNTQHLIAQNIANGSARVQNPDPNVSIFNFHYATPPEAVAANYGLNKIIADDETGFKGIADRSYRQEAWEFILAGGAVFDHLDYSFTAGHENGTFELPLKQPGGGSPALRRQLKALKDFIHRVDFVRMKPNNDLFKGGIPVGATARALIEPGQAYALYIRGGTQANLKLDLPAGAYQVEWLNPRSGNIDKKETLNHRGGSVLVASPDYEEDIALRIMRSGK